VCKVNADLLAEPSAAELQTLAQILVRMRERAFELDCAARTNKRADSRAAAADACGSTSISLSLVAGSRTQQMCRIWDHQTGSQSPGGPKSGPVPMRYQETFGGAKRQNPSRINDLGFW